MNVLDATDLHPADGSNQRREERHPLRTDAILQRKTGERILGSTINISGSGVLLDVAQAEELRLGEEVGCQIHLYDGKPPQDWGVGKVVRVDNCRVAVEFTSLDWDA